MDRDEDNFSRAKNIFFRKEEVFSSVSQLRKVLVSLYQELSQSNSDFLFKGYQVKFTDVLEEEIHLNHKENVITILMPFPEEQDPQLKSKLEKEIRHQRLIDYHVSADDMKSRALVTLYLSLSEEARKTILSEPERKV